MCLIVIDISLICIIHHPKSSTNTPFVYTEPLWWHCWALALGEGNDIRAPNCHAVNCARNQCVVVRQCGRCHDDEHIVYSLDGVTFMSATWYTTVVVAACD
jgi:hypothetical protein